MSEGPSVEPARSRWRVAAYRAGASVKSVWHSGLYVLARRAAGPLAAEENNAEPRAKADRAVLLAALREAFDKDAADIAAGLYPAPPTLGPTGAVQALREARAFLEEAQRVNARRLREGRTEVRDALRAAGAADPYPTYYLQNFHYQTGGWLSDHSAAVYETQVEALFAGSAAAMRRRGLSLLAKAWRKRDHRGLRFADLACGDGGFLFDVLRAFPRLEAEGVDLSPPYLERARQRVAADFPQVRFVQGQIEALPIDAGHLDGASAVYLFHELPPRVRPLAFAEIARVLRPGGLFVLTDSVQPQDCPDLDALLQAFPVYFHEPYYKTYLDTDLDALAAQAGLVRVASDQAFLTKSVLYQRR